MRSVADAILPVGSILPVSDTGGSAVNGVNSLDTKGYNSAEVFVSVAALTGTPTTTSLVWKVQESANGTSGWADALDNTGVAIGGTITAANTLQTARVEGLGGLNRKRYLRVTETTTFTGGSTPSLVVGAFFLFGRAYQAPVQTPTDNNT